MDWYLYRCVYIYIYISNCLRPSRHRAWLVLVFLGALTGMAELVDGPIDHFTPWVSVFICEYFGSCFGTLGNYLCALRVDFGFILVLLESIFAMETMWLALSHDFHIHCIFVCLISASWGSGTRSRPQTSYYFHMPGHIIFILFHILWKPVFPSVHTDNLCNDTLRLPIDTA